jgi:dipeptidyl aminopeptidase/acylaminoacyl peptidase
MPWDGCELWLAPFAEDGTIKAPRLLAGGPEESIYQPGWSPDGKLYFVSDRDGWWKPYRFDQPSDPAALPVPAIKHVPRGSEFGRPQWMFGTATWAFAGESRLVCAYTRAGFWQLATVDLASGSLSNPIADLMPRPWLAASGDNVVLVTGSTSRPDAVVRLDLSAGRVDILRVASERKVDPAYVSVAEAITFPSTGNRTAHAFYYAPKNREYIAPAGERPPLIVISHGGPTSAASPTLDLEIQFWTTRGFAVVDVNYGGSSGYGREYRELLNGQWGVVDVQDCINAGRYLAGQGKADRRRMVIRGGSAGGYTTLAALTFHPTVFTAGASYYGISDLEALARDSHKFESRSLDTLVGPYPAMRDLYRVRSPIHYADRLACPLILFQGLEDKVVPPQQSEMMAAAVRAKGLQVVHLTFAGEQHGFRKGETILRCLNEELKFYRSVLGE